MTSAVLQIIRWGVIMAVRGIACAQVIAPFSSWCDCAYRFGVGLDGSRTAGESLRYPRPLPSLGQVAPIPVRLKAYTERGKNEQI